MVCCLARAFSSTQVDDISAAKALLKWYDERISSQGTASSVHRVLQYLLGSAPGQLGSDFASIVIQEECRRSCGQRSLRISCASWTRPWWSLRIQQCLVSRQLPDHRSLPTGLAPSVLRRTWGVVRQSMLTFLAFFTVVSVLGSASASVSLPDSMP